eukprot:2842479-Amphidinium_carterae.1
MATSRRRIRKFSGEQGLPEGLERQRRKEDQDGMLQLLRVPQRATKCMESNDGGNYNLRKT